MSFDARAGAAVEVLLEAAGPEHPAHRWQRDRLQTLLVEAHREATAAWRDVDVPLAEFAAHLGSRLDPDLDLVDAFGALPVADLLLACACERGDAAAVVELERHFFGDLRAVIGRVDASGDFVDEVLQRLRARLLVAADGRPPGIASYRGRGGLHAWLRVTATRDALMLRRGEQRRAPADDDLLIALSDPAVDIELSFLQRSYRAIVKEAFADAIAQLEPDERNLLRYAVLDGLTIDEIGAIYDVHRTTAFRRLRRARDALGGALRQAIALRLGNAPDDVTDVVELVQSKVTLSLERLLQE